MHTTNAQPSHAHVGKLCFSGILGILGLCARYLGQVPCRFVRCPLPYMGGDQPGAPVNPNMPPLGEHGLTGANADTNVTLGVNCQRLSQQHSTMAHLACLALLSERVVPYTVFRQETKVCCDYRIIIYLILSWRGMNPVA